MGSANTPPQQHKNLLTRIIGDYLTYWIVFYLIQLSLQSATMERHPTDMVPLGRDGFFKDPFFSSTWEEFDQERNLRMSNSQNNFWEKV